MLLSGDFEDTFGGTESDSHRSYPLFLQLNPPCPSRASFPYPYPFSCLSFHSIYNFISGIDMTSIAQSPLGQQDLFGWDGCAQELDIASGNPTNNFLFCALSSVSPQSTPISASDSFTATAPANGWDYVHIHSAEKDETGNHLISARHNTHSVYYVDGSTSQIIWALGASTIQTDTSSPSNDPCRPPTPQISQETGRS
ncbi:hypothetical protein D9758_012801 [Tetrapyrgos nigripes]|uniref:Uncharacterized protein n=1 Tax=Tetrapyrgos nigripes TaxID=182062 RepID=A0A8H5FV59_9AGAR|nr:hypothetical protein D9758_012801 [Tetrapyrgos nigripes]